MSDVEFMAFCHDFFPDIVMQFGYSQLLAAKINILVEKCLRKPYIRQRVIELLFVNQ
jgi:hypothetical protein